MAQETIEEDSALVVFTPTKDVRRHIFKTLTQDNAYIDQAISILLKLAFSIEAFLPARKRFACDSGVVHSKAITSWLTFEIGTMK